MFFDCKADYVACALLSRFDTVTKQERDVVQYILELIPCYDIVTGKLRMTRDAHILAQIYLTELRVLAGWHSYVHEGSLEDPAQARALLSVVVIPLVRHLSTDEYEDILESMHVAEALLSVNVAALNKLMEHWRLSHMELIHGWRTYPIDGEKNWCYGYAMSLPFRPEDLMTALPYPVKEEWRTDWIEDEKNKEYEVVGHQVMEEANGKVIPRPRKLRKALGRNALDKLEEGKAAKTRQPGETTDITLPLVPGGMILSSSWSSMESSIWTAVDELEPKACEKSEWEGGPRTTNAKDKIKHGVKALLRLERKQAM
ncbi:hypothetical protein FRC07_010341 [Ceratobasidium sp. 392]|nr:hypothetical protein FRC07_010341 [Ceratobasidium sp. 392]